MNTTAKNARAPLNRWTRPRCMTAAVISATGLRNSSQRQVTLAGAGGAKPLTATSGTPGAGTVGVPEAPLEFTTPTSQMNQRAQIDTFACR